MKKGPLNLSVMLITLLILVIIFREKYVYLAPNLNVSISTFIYSFTFLIPILIINWTKYKDGKNIIKITTKIMIIFLILSTLLCTISGNLDSSSIEDSLRNILTPNSMVLGNIVIQYPELNLIGFILIYYFSHNILISVYEALKSYTNKYLSYSLAIFIAFIIDTMFTVPLTHIKEIYYANIGMLEIVKHLTANFMVVIFTSLLMIIIFTFYTHLKEKKKN